MGSTIDYRYLLLAETSRSMMFNLLQKFLGNLSWFWSSFHLNFPCEYANVVSDYCISALVKSK